jgi:hypothetical protein
LGRASARGARLLPDCVPTYFGVDIAVTAEFSLVIYFFALSRRLPDDVVRERLRSGAEELESDAEPADGPRETEGASARERMPGAR